MEKFSYLQSSNVEYIDELYQKYLENPDSIDDTWRFLFEGIELGEQSAVAAAPPVTPTAKPSIDQINGGVGFSQEAKVVDLIQAYRQRGHLIADLNPLDQGAKREHPLLDLKQFGFSAVDLDTKFRAARLLGLGEATLRDIIGFLKETYCSSIGVEYTHMQDLASLDWLQQQMEKNRNRSNFSSEQKRNLLWKLTQAESFEQFLHTRYIGAKRFSVEGGDAIIAALDTTIQTAGSLGCTDLVLGMAHRGRLNVLTNIFGKKYEVVFSEFEGNYNSSAGEGDVKYHMGYSADVLTTSGSPMHLSLLANPSHLEAVNPLVEGVVRAKQDQKKDAARSRVLPVLIHGDAAFAGQGVIYETLQLSKLNGYTTGGTLHFVINNQVGFTTNPVDSRSTPYSTDVAKMLESPIFHVNGDDVEAVAHVTQLALQFLRTFKRDVVIDIICYRRFGHNEGDEPSYTQPLMYKKIKNHPTPRAVYASVLARSGALAEAESKQLLEKSQATLTASQAITKQEAPVPTISVFESAWKGLRQSQESDFGAPVKTGVSEDVLKSIASSLSKVPAGFQVHPKLMRLLESRQKMVSDRAGIDWGMGESLSFGSLLCEGISVRITGQDVERGTFSHRQSVLNDFETGAKYTPLNHIKPGQSLYEVHNSALSEYAVLGFEFGYSLAEPRSLVIWEAQFGDFANGAQIIIDQFLSSAESKWLRMSGLVLLLPHGYEGQGPEHSSARLERFLQLCGRNNMTVCNLTTPAQIFHALRRQVVRPFRMPLVVMSPKSLLRHPQAVSNLDEFISGCFKEVIDDSAVADPAQVNRLLLCSGKIYYDLAAEREKLSRKDVAIIRVEELYPWPKAQIAGLFQKYTGVSEVCWVQEEPRNMGSWRAMFESITESLPSGMKLRYIGRDVAASPAVGSPKRHEKEQRAIVEQCYKEENRS